jgi:hypothetical protein
MLNEIGLEFLPDGTALEVVVPAFPLPVPHQGILRRGWDGQAWIDQNSKEHGRTATTTYADFSKGRTVRIIYIPRTQEESLRITQNARNDIARSIAWSVADNCQDFVSRAITGRNGSKSRDAAIGVALLGLVIWLVAR